MLTRSCHLCLGFLDVSDSGTVSQVILAIWTSHMQTSAGVHDPHHRLCYCRRWIFAGFWTAGRLQPRLLVIAFDCTFFRLSTLAWAILRSISPLISMPQTSGLRWASAQFFDLFKMMLWSPQVELSPKHAAPPRGQSKEKRTNKKTNS